MPDVSTWVRRCQAGDLEAFSALFKQYQQRVYSLAATILKDEAAADDVVQETFLAMFVKIGSYSGASSFETWLVAITVNCCRDRLRRRKVRRALSLDRLKPALLARFLGGGPDPARIVERQHGRATLWKLVDELDDRLRLPLILCYRYDYSPGEVARILGANTNRIYQQLHEGRRRLRLLVEANEERLVGGADDTDDAEYSLYQRRL